MKDLSWGVILYSKNMSNEEACILYGKIKDVLHMLDVPEWAISVKEGVKIPKDLHQRKELIGKTEES